MRRGIRPARARARWQAPSASTARRTRLSPCTNACCTPKPAPPLCYTHARQTRVGGSGSRGVGSQRIVSQGVVSRETIDRETGEYDPEPHPDSPTPRPPDYSVRVVYVAYPALTMQAANAIQTFAT